MERKIKNNFLILQYKTFFEQDKLVQSEVKDGNADLNYYLNYFRNKLDIKKNENQELIFDNIFFKNLIVPPQHYPVKPSPKKNNLENNSVERKKTPAWVKKIYKQIVNITHPDKIESIKIDFIKNKLVNQYMLAVESYKLAQYENLLMIAHDLEIDYLEDVVEKTLQPKIKKLESKIKESQKLLAYHWFHLPENKKNETLKNYLINLGFVFTDEELKEAISKRDKNKRKPGSRPVNLRNRRIKSS